MMTAERWAQIKDLFAVVVEKPVESRSAALADLCKGDDDLCAQVRRLLAQHDEMGGFLEGTSPKAADEPAQMLQPGDTLADRYKIEKLLGSGGMGEVYAAQDLELGERIAVKIIRQETVFGSDVIDRLRREVQLARRVTHPNVCRVFDLGHHRQGEREIIFLTMELVGGETLTARLKRKGKIAPVEAMQIATQLCQALGAAHEAGILHRDFKCGNVMLPEEGEGRAVVTDFGIARWMRPGDDHKSAVTQQGAVVGTPAYMSPEQLMGEPLTPASDIYSLGLVLYEMVTGVRPFRGESSWTETLKRLASDPAAPVKVVPDLDPRWNRTILRCLQRDPLKRFATTRQVLDSLRDRYRYSAGDVPRPVLAVASGCLLVLVVSGIAFRDRIWPASLPRQKHVAVIPFTPAGGGPADQASAVGLAESLTGNLARLQASESSLWVVPWKEVRNQKPGDESTEPGAYEFYEQGRGYLLRYVPEDVDQAIVLFQTAIGKDPRFALAQANLAYAYAWKFRNTHEVKWHDLAQEMCGRALALNDKLAPAHVAQGMIFQETGEIDSSVKEYETALQLDPSNDEALTLLSLAYEKNGKLLQAEALFKDALKRTPGSWVSYNYLGAFYYRHQQYAQAEPLFRTATQLAPDNPLAFYNLGGLYLAEGRDDQAEKILIKAIAIRPNFGAYSNLGIARFRQGRYADAAEMFQKATELRPADQRLWRNLGDAYVLAGNRPRAMLAYDEAVLQLRKVLALRPNDGELQQEMALYYAKLGNRAQAKTALARASRLSPNDAGFLFNTALIDELLGDREHALTALRAAVQAGFPSQQIKDARELDQLRTDARYARIVGSPSV